MVTEASAATDAPRTRRQAYLSAALRHAREVQQNHSVGVQKIYGGLCHNLPMLIRANGLCQTIAFVEDKAGGQSETDRARAYRLLREHIAATLGLANARDLPDRVGDSPMAQYVRDTQRLIEAWTYYKRFAVSILGVESAEEAH